MEVSENDDLEDRSTVPLELPEEHLKVTFGTNVVYKLLHLLAKIE